LLCSKCRELDAAARHRWCLPCQAEYRREHRRTVTTLVERKAFHAGEQAMKARIIELFAGLDWRELNGLTAAEIVRTQV